MELDVLLDNFYLTTQALKLIETNMDAVADFLAGAAGVINNKNEIIAFLDAYARKCPTSLRLLAMAAKREMLQNQKQGEPFLEFELY